MYEVVLKRFEQPDEVRVFEKGKFEVSKAIANLDLLPAIEAATPDTVIVADGFSCREQISHLAHRPSLHFAEVLDSVRRSRD